MGDNRQPEFFDDISALEGVSVAKLSSYFGKKYKLDAAQVGGLVVSSAKSLIEFTSKADSLMKEHGEDLEREHLRALVHSGVGIFRTMGEDAWADCLGALSKGSGSELFLHFQAFIKQVQKSFSDIIETA